MKVKGVDLRKLVDKLKRNNLFVLIGILMVLLSSVITITQGYSVIKEQYEKSFGYKNKLLGQIIKLSAEVNIGYFKDILGSPVFINDYDKTMRFSESLESTGYTEYVFVNKYFFVQALSDEHDKVIAYSVTTRKVNFNPTINNVKLGITKFSTLGQGESDSLVSILGAHDFYYHEAYYGANPGNYQTIVYALNESGYGGIEDSSQIQYPTPPDKRPGERLSLSDPDIQKFRNLAIINTYTVSAPLVFFNKDLDSFRFGPDYNQIRILPRK